MTLPARKIALSLLAALSIAFGFADGSDYFPPPDKDGGWRTLTDAAKVRKLAAMDLARLDQAFEFEKETSQHGGLLVVRHGYLVYEKYFGRGHREAHPDMASIGKAFTSVASGVMLQEKRDQFPQGLDTRVFTEKYLPQAFRWTIPRRRISLLDSYFP
jgi:Beta-lactamase.